MAEGHEAKYIAQVVISAQSVGWFLEMLKKEGLRDKFLAEAPQNQSILAAEDVLLNSNIFGGSARITPKTLAHGLDGFPADKSDASDGMLEASLSVEPELMEFARSFALAHNLAVDYPIAKNLEMRKCGNGIECEPGK